LFGFSSAFKKGSFWRGIICGLPLILSQVMSLFFFFSENVGNPSVDWKPWYLIVYSVFTIVGVGIREECIYRATLQNIIAKKYTNSVKGIWITVIFSSLFFGLCHISNVFFGMEPISVLTQVISAAFLGLLYGAIYLRSGNIWVLIVLHSVTDIAGLAGSNFLVGSNDIEQMSETMAFSIGKAIMWLIYIGFAIFLLRPSKCEEIFERFRRENEAL
jgi:membrane protease YdiL (CAAX protease family)